jgi:hypothetical protein
MEDLLIEVPLRTIREPLQILVSEYTNALKVLQDVSTQLRHLVLQDYALLNDTLCRREKTLRRVQELLEELKQLEPGAAGGTERSESDEVSHRSYETGRDGGG